MIIAYTFFIDIMRRQNCVAHLTENVLYSCMKENSKKPMKTLSEDAKYWLPLIKEEHFTWLTPEARKKVKRAKTLDEF